MNHEKRERTDEEAHRRLAIQIPAEARQDGRGDTAAQAQRATTGAAQLHQRARHAITHRPQQHTDTQKETKRREKPKARHTINGGGMRRAAERDSAQRRRGCRVKDSDESPKVQHPQHTTIRAASVTNAHAIAPFTAKGKPIGARAPRLSACVHQDASRESALARGWSAAIVAWR